MIIITREVGSGHSRYEEGGMIVITREMSSGHSRHGKGG